MFSQMCRIQVLRTCHSAFSNNSYTKLQEKAISACLPHRVPSVNNISMHLRRLYGLHLTDTRTVFGEAMSAYLWRQMLLTRRQPQKWKRRQNKYRLPVRNTIYLVDGCPVLLLLLPREVLRHDVLSIYAINEDETYESERYTSESFSNREDLRSTFRLLDAVSAKTRPLPYLCMTKGAHRAWPGILSAPESASSFRKTR